MDERVSNAPCMEPQDQQQGLHGLSRRGSWNPMASPATPPPPRVAPPTGSSGGGMNYSVPSHGSAATTASYRKSTEPVFDICDADKHEIRLAFELFDTRKVGRLCYRDMKVAMRALECDVKKAEVQQLMQKYSKDDVNEITQDEFMQIMMRKYRDKDPERTIMKVYAVFDEEGKGKIDIKNVRRVVRELGEVFTDEQLEAMITEFDKDGDGEVTANEFFEIMRK